jgi:hypothetical protein
MAVKTYNVDVDKTVENENYLSIDKLLEMEYPMKNS